MILAATSLSMALAQQADHEKHHQPSQSNDGKMDSMMPMMQSMMPMRMEMHQRHMSQGNPWMATDEAVFALQGNQLLKYDADLKLAKQVDLKLAKQVDLPKEKSDASPEHAEHHSSGNNEYDHELTLQAQTQPPEQKAMKCPMCEQMMKQKNAEAAD